MIRSPAPPMPPAALRGGPSAEKSPLRCPPARPVGAHVSPPRRLRPRALATAQSPPAPSRAPGERRLRAAGASPGPGRPARWALFGLAAALAVGCAGDPTPEASESPTATAEAVDRGALLAAAAEVAIYPDYQATDAQLDALITALDALAASPEEGTLSDARGAWRAVREPWSRGAAHHFGPSRDLRTTSAVDWWPVDTEKIDALIAGDGPVDVDAVAALGADVRGLMAMEYLLFDRPEATPALEALVAEPRRGALLASWARYADTGAAALAAAWGPAGGGGYTDAFTAAGEGSEVYDTRQAALDDLVNGLVHAAELIADRDLAEPIGLTQGGEPQPQVVKGALADSALADILATLAGIRAVYFGPQGAQGPFLTALVRSRSPDIDDAVAADLDAAVAAVAAIPLPLDEVVLSDPQSVEAAYVKVKDLHRTLAVDVAGLLGVTLTFSDNDGD